MLICSRHLNLVATVRMSGEPRVVWSWGDKDLQWPHHPTVLQNGHLQIYDNRTIDRASRVIELDPRSGEIVWQYNGTEKEPFFSWIRGASQRLPNGNVLITESERSRVFEVTPAGETVWEFFGELVGRKRKVIYRMMRLTANQEQQVAALLDADRTDRSAPMARVP